VAIDRASILRNAEKLLRQGKLDEAIAAYLRAVEDQPRDWNTANTLGDLYLRVGQTDRAVAQYVRIADSLSHDGFRERQARAASPVCVENVGWNYRTPGAQLNGWTESPSHNANLLDARITQAGVGEASGYVTFIACA